MSKIRPTKSQTKKVDQNSISLIVKKELFLRRKQHFIGRSNFMTKTIYEWKYGENDCLKYYEVKFKKGKDYLCIYANKKYPDLWM